MGYEGFLKMGEFAHMMYAGYASSERNAPAVRAGSDYHSSRTRLMNWEKDRMECMLICVYSYIYIYIFIYVIFLFLS